MKGHTFMLGFLLMGTTSMGICEHDRPKPDGVDSVKKPGKTANSRNSDCSRVSASAPPGGAGEQKLTIVIYDRAGVRAEMLAGAENTTSGILARAGVQAVWREGINPAERRDAVHVPIDDPATLVVTLQPESEIAHYGVRSACGGIAYNSSVVIFVNKFDATATWLGHIIAHELGHILLGPNAHTVTGIMHGTFVKQDWVQASQGMLRFTKSQSQQMRNWIAERRGAEPPGSPGEPSGGGAADALSCEDSNRGSDLNRLPLQP